jgi:Holliday junction resolvase RusA-like endonuclease
MAICSSRGCGNQTTASHFTKCASCLLGTRRLDKLVAQYRAVEQLPPLAVPAGVWAFRVPGLPVAWNNALIRYAGRRPFLAPKAREWKQQIALAAMQTRPGGWPLDRRYDVELTSVFANPRADADGPVKLVLDALTGCAWTDDRLVARVTASKLVDADAPRIEVVLRLAAQERA